MLEKYIQKRDFKKTSEPKGKLLRKKNGFHYLIQKHAARRLHFDFRLEYDGVLKSWAVPKGPSVDPSVKRLAVEVEDHPLEYGKFEGTIPKGEYGGGTVMLWDEGEWEPLIDPKAGLKKGHLLFNLKGSRLKGKWNLVRSHQKDGANEKPIWFLIKAKESPGSKNKLGEPVEKYIKSVTTGRTLEEISSGPLNSWTQKKKDSKTKTQKKIAAPKFKKPQLATLVSEIPPGDEWLHEIKFDGYRMQALVDNQGAQPKVKIISRNEKDWTSKLKPLVTSLMDLKCKTAVLDGEVVALNKKSISDFQLLQNAFESGENKNLYYFMFDILELNGEDLSSKALIERKILLQDLLKSNEYQNLKFSDHLEKAKNFLPHACRMGLEGIVSKLKTSKYVSGRSATWVKAKCEKRQEFVIVGYSAPKGSRTGLGALLLAIHDTNKNLKYAGRVGTGFDSNLLQSLEKKLALIKTQAATLTNLPKGVITRDVTWVLPKYLCEVKFSEWTKDDMLRHPVFVGLREDKKAQDILKDVPSKKVPSKEVPIKGSRFASTSQTVFDGVTITKPEKVMFSPDITKKDLAEYYFNLKDLIIPYLNDRPISIVRCPDGHGKMCFFQKHPFHEKRFITISNTKELITYSQQGSLEFHIWGSRLSDIEKPDMIVFDLDPDSGVKWERIATAAFYLRDVLQKMGLKSFLKTTGGKGLHIVAPFTPGHDWDYVKALSKKIADGMSQLEPELYLAKMSKAKRKNKIFIDYLRNSRGATFVAPYSTRTKAHATVSMPISWTDLKNGISPDFFTVRNTFAYLKKRKVDPWKDFFTVQQSLPRVNLKT